MGQRYPAGLLALFVVLLLASCVGAIHPARLVLEHVLTVVLLAALLATHRRFPLSHCAYTLVFLFLLLHLVGARHTYVRVPYDAWSEALLGVRPTEALGWSRNHYDRFVHLCFGLLLLRPARELIERHPGLSPGWAAAAAALLLFGLGSLYELLEWLVALVLSPETAERYNGQQGDPWDAQKDMALNLAGVVLAALVDVGRGRARGRR